MAVTISPYCLGVVPAALPPRTRPSLSFVEKFSMRIVPLFSLIGICFAGLCCHAPTFAGEDVAGKYLIVHADDAGMSHSVNRGTIDALETGVVNSASIMVPCAWFVEFAEYAKDHPEFDYGIHLTLTSEWDHYRWGPVIDRGKVSSLVDSDGYLWDNVSLVAANVLAAEVDLELRGQIDRAKQFGVPLSHLDTHMGALLARPDLVEVYARLALDYDLPILFVRDREGRIAKAYPAVAERAAAITKELDAKGLPILDSVLQFYGGKTHEQRLKTYNEALSNLKPGVTEMIIHCGYADDELRAITTSAERRDGDRRIFSSAAMGKLLADQGVELITWKELHQKTLAKAAE
jgi:predicted glycoside hydrolase/deacetylase ChbG (UPF0249 family)